MIVFYNHGLWKTGEILDKHFVFSMIGAAITGGYNYNLRL